MTVTKNDLAIRDLADTCKSVLEEVSRVVVGKQAVLEKLMTAFLAGGHVLMEDYPGLAKTLIAKSFAATLGISFKRIQFTPDLLPADITGGYIYDRSESRFILREGPIFANIVLADEINRASPRTQSALLEAMQEYQVTLEGETMKVPQPFIVIATQNPIEYEGTFPLPEAQLDRFMMRLSVGYPSPEEEEEILKRRMQRKTDELELSMIAGIDTLVEMRRTVENIQVDPDILRYMVELVTRTRTQRQVAVGSSPRGALALLKLTRAWAAVQGRSYVLPDDVKLFAKPALCHRLILQPDLWTTPQAADQTIDEILQSTAVPVVDELG
jgi:MoxR-like ATPase